jgi:hypothetical protein
VSGLGETRRAEAESKCLIFIDGKAAALQFAAVVAASTVGK